MTLGLSGMFLVEGGAGHTKGELGLSMTLSESCRSDRWDLHVELAPFLISHAVESSTARQDQRTTGLE